MTTWTFLGSGGAGNDDYELLEEVPLREGVIGCDPSCDIVLHDPLIIPRHARVVHQDGRWFIGGDAPTFVNGELTPPGRAVLLETGSTVALGGTRFRVGWQPLRRQAVDVNDATARACWLDDLAERGHPLVDALAAGGPIDLPRRIPEMNGVECESTFTNGMLVSVRLREPSVACLRALLASPISDSLQHLSIEHPRPGINSAGRRAFLQVLAETVPPALRTVSFGVRSLDEPFDGEERDWSVIQTRIPLEGTARESVRAAGTPRIRIVESPPGWPLVGTVIEFPLGHAEEFMPLVVGPGLERPLLLSVQGARFTIITAPPQTRTRPPINGEVFEHLGLRFIFEED